MLLLLWLLLFWFVDIVVAVVVVGRFVVVENKATITDYRLCRWC
jgi:hypothetical protein